MIRIITQDGCRWCDKAKDLMYRHSIVYEELKIPNSFSKEEFYSLVEEYETTPSVPKIFKDKELIGGYADFVEYVENHQGNIGEGGF